jgi:hypothetical protein
VQQLQSLSILAQARRLKSVLGNTELEKFQAMQQSVRDTFNKIRIEYGYEKAAV